MVNLEYSVTSWGSPTAPKRALLLHGMMGTGAVFFKVAEILIKNGYVRHAHSLRVDAPDLLGHGWAPHAPSSERYTVPLLASYLAQHVSKEKYDVVAGVSFGSTAILPLLAQMQHPPARAVLVEPILDMPCPTPERIAEMLGSCSDPPSEEKLMQSNPKWIREEAILKRMAFVQMDSRLITELFDEVKQGNLSHSLIPTPSSLPATEIIILAADPDLASVYPASNAALLEKSHPHVKFGRIMGATHDTHKTAPGVVADVIMNGMTGAMGVEVLRS
ncbi:Alpha/Beta hydrolase protein [Dioszegia hungarica]|uniref:Alpha/Beta hydrolase protein n=1 Tax=Dioszegia hungarica TaxID=4972 RepID=A0AA38HCY3_9TREE|nr:Alpha/Beta hydrolase protein [Dioszegia hungarica]KAI9638290.1 Alpha/Beta hydrolase protein [Dioszegia hungarica]